MIFSNRIHLLQEHHRMHLRVLDIPEVRMLEADPQEYEEARRLWKRTLPHADETTLHTKALGHLAHHQHHKRLREADSKRQRDIERHLHTHSRVQTWLMVFFLILLLAFFFAPRAHAQFSHINTVQTKNAGSALGFHASPFIINCSTNTACTDDGTTLTITASSTGATAWSAITAAANANAGTFSASGNTFDFSGVTLMKFRFSGGATTSTNGDQAYDTTAKIWHIWQNAADKFLIASSNLGTSGQPCLSNADGSCTFADPIVSQATASLLNAQVVGNVASAAADSGNPVKTGGVFNTTQPTVTNGQRVDGQSTARGAAIVAPGVDGFAITSADGGIATLGAKADNKSTSTDTTATSIVSILKELSAMAQAPAALPANQSVNVNQLAGSQLVADPCQVNAKVYDSFSVTASTQLISGTSAKKIYFCSWNDQSAAAENYAIVEGTGSVCATGIAKFPGMSGGTTAATGWNVPAGGGRTMGNGTGAIAQEGTNADNVCILLSGSTQVNGGYSYVVQ